MRLLRSRLSVERIGLFAGYSFPQGGKRGKPGLPDETGGQLAVFGSPLARGGGADEARQGIEQELEEQLEAGVRGDGL